MKKIFLSVLFVLLFALNAFALDETFTLWESQTFTKSGSPYGHGEIIGTSVEILNENGRNSMDIIIKYESLTPDGLSSGSRIHAIVEAQILGKWFPINAQTTGIFNTATQATTQILTTVPRFNRFNSDVTNFVVRFQNIYLFERTIRGGGAPEKFRVKLMTINAGSSDFLTSLTVSGFGRKYDREFAPFNPGAPE